MSDESFITFVCGFCEHAIKAPASSEGRVGRCPHCHRPIVAPQVCQTPDGFERIEFCSRRQMQGLFQGAAVSLLFHAILISAMGVIILRSPELGRTLLVTLFLDTEGTEMIVDADPLEIPSSNQGSFEGDITWSADGLSDVENAISNRIGVAGVPGRGGRRGVQGTEVSEPMARFSPTAIERLEKQPAAKMGDYEIALFWDGPSDLDVHVVYESAPSAPPFTINYMNRGTPETGFLDVDANASHPHIDDPIEHIRWNAGVPPRGLYRIRVHGYCLRSRKSTDPASVPFTLEIKSPAGIRSHTGIVGLKEFVEIDILPIDISSEELAKYQETAEQQLLAAEKQLESKDRNERGRAKAALREIQRRYPTTAYAAKARKLLKSIK